MQCYYIQISSLMNERTSVRYWCWWKAVYVNKTTNIYCLKQLTSNSPLKGSNQLTLYILYIWAGKVSYWTNFLFHVEFTSYIAKSIKKKYKFSSPGFFVLTSLFYKSVNGLPLDSMTYSIRICHSIKKSYTLPKFIWHIVLWHPLIILYVHKRWRPY
jgi:hypothetical protein